MRPVALALARCMLAVVLAGCRILGVSAEQPPSSPPPVSPSNPHAGHGDPAEPSDGARDGVRPAASGEEQSDRARTPVRELTDADRAAAFPVLHDRTHDVHGRSLNSLVLFEQLEWRNADADHFAWDSKAWVGGDLDRFWVRAEGDAEDGGVQEAQVHVLYGRAISRWWDVVAGVRQDWRPGPAQTWAAIGVQGLAPYFFDVEATAYVGAEGRSHVRVETAYDLLITNRLIAQPLLEFELAAKADPLRRVGAGLTVGEVSVRLRYEFRREFAPYLGVLWRRTFFGTADLARREARSVGGVSLTLGGRVWF